MPIPNALGKRLFSKQFLRSMRKLWHSFCFWSRERSMIELTNVSKSYNRGRIKAVDSLTLTVRPGEIFGFLGPNGAGKTTTLKMIVGLLQPDSGRVAVEGFDICANPIEAKQVTTYVPDYPAIYDRLTGLEYLNFIGDVYGVPKEARLERMNKWLEIFELSPVISNPIQSYSHGMKQKIVLTAALLPSPRVMVLDEPLVGLDPRAAFQLKDLFREHCEQGKTLLFSTHIMEVAEKLCDRIGIIHKGRLLACGSMEELRALGKAEHSLERIFLELTDSE
jgi:ABC-2 type transport system ATP-binding protein